MKKLDREFFYFAGSKAFMGCLFILTYLLYSQVLILESLKLLRTLGWTTDLALFIYLFLSSQARMGFCQKVCSVSPYITEKPKGTFWPTQYFWILWLNFWSHISWHVGDSLMAHGSESRVCLQCGRPEFDPWVKKIPWRRKWQCAPVFLPGKSHEWRSLTAYRATVHRVTKSQTQLNYFVFTFIMTWNNMVGWI